jgi:hypothetical protein
VFDFFLPHWLQRKRPAEVSRVVVGSTGSGKSEGELADLQRVADRGDHAVVLLDGHGPLAFRAAGHWAARGHENRIVYEPLDATDPVLCWDMLPRSTEADPSRRRIEDTQVRDDAAQCFLAQRNLDTLVDRPWTQEWLHNAIDLCLAQPGPEPLSSLPSAFRIGTREYRRLIEGCGRDEVVGRFLDLERLRRKNEVQYEITTGAARRLIELVCGSEVVRLRCRPGTFQWQEALKARRLIAFDGGGLRSREVKRAVFLLAALQVVNAVRRHFAETRRPLPVVLVMEEAGAMGLVAPFVLAALQELRKAGLAIRVITQSSLDFGDERTFERVLANVPEQVWYQALAPADQELGARALANPSFDPHAVHFTRKRSLLSKAHAEDYYKLPPFQEQEFRTLLATLRRGERLVRDRRGVRRERGKLVRSAWWNPVTEEGTRDLLQRLRRQPIYLPGCPPVLDPPEDLPDAAERIRQRQSQSSGSA